MNNELELARQMSMLSDFSVSGLIAGLVFGVIGFWMFKVSKQRENPSTRWIGIILMVYPIFVSNDIANWGIGIALCLLAKHLW